MFSEVSDADLLAYWEGSLSEQDALEVKRLIYTQAHIRERYSEVVEHAGQQAEEALSRETE